MRSQMQKLAVVSLSIASVACGVDSGSGGSDANTFQLTDDEVGKTITVTANYVDNDGFEETVTSAPTAAIEPEPEIVVDPISFTDTLRKHTDDT